MQATNLLTQLSGASAQPPARTNAQAQAEHSGAQFSQALSREMVQRDPAPRPSGAAPQRAEPAPKQAEKMQARQAEKAQPRQAEKAQPAKQETDHARESGAAGHGEAAPAAGQTDASASSDEAAAEAAARAAEQPVTDMLALVAGINQLQTQAPKDAAPAERLASGASTGLAAGPAPAFDAGRASETTAFAAPATGAAVAGDDAAPGAITLGKDMLPVADTGEPAQFAAALRERIEPAAMKDAQAAISPNGPAQAATLSMAQAASGVAGDRIPARVGTPAWDNQISQKVVFMLAGKDQSATLTLNPPDLGPVQVVLNVSNDQASVAFSANQLEVRQALENAMPKLKEMLGESGIALGNATVDAGSPDQRQAQAERDAGGARGPRFGGAGSAAETAAQPARPVRAATLPGRVDTFA